MRENAALGAIRRRWWIVVLFTIAGAVLGALPQPERVEEQERTFSATHTLLLNDVADQEVTTAVSPTQVPLFVTTGEVPARAATALEYGGNPASLAAGVSSFFDFTTGSLTISYSGSDAERTELVANTFADELIAYLAERQDIVYQERLARSIERLAELEAELVNVTQELSRRPEDPVLLSQQNAISRRYSVAFEQSETLEASPPVLGFTTLQRAQAVDTTDRGLGAPRSRTSRGILAGLVGLAIGVGAVILLSTVDRRIRSREQAEEALDLRARVLIPKVRDKDRDQLVVRPGRHDALSDSYRTMRNVVAFVLGPQVRDRAPIVMIVSPSPGDGKTSMAVNLAAASAESGRRTILINADFRRPRLANVFGPDAEQPLPFMRDDVIRLSAKTLITSSGIDRLRLLDLSRVDGDAGELVRITIDKLDEIARASDAIFIDTAPIGATAEVLDIVPHADAIVMVTRVGHTTRAQAQRSIAILRDVTTAPILLGLGGLKDQGTSYDEYTDALKPGTETRRRWWRRSRPAVDESHVDREWLDDTDEHARGELRDTPHDSESEQPLERAE